MTDYPMIFSAPMVRALQAGIKTQTRRIITPGNSLFNGGKWSAFHKRQEWDWEGAWVDGGPSPMGNPGPYLKLLWLAGDYDFTDTVHRIYPVIQPGDRIWVKEAWRFDAAWDECKPSEMHAGDAICYEADGAQDVRAWGRPFTPGRYRSTRFMSRWASRITLTVNEVRAQRVQDISEADAIAEGIKRLVGSKGPNHFTREIVGKWSGSFNAPSAQEVYAELWDSIHGPDAWARNDWVWAYSFSVHHGNIDSMGGRG
jgi:hypothetical protein